MQVNLTDLPTNRIYKLKISAITRGIFSKAQYMGEFSDAVSFALGGKTSQSLLLLTRLKVFKLDLFVASFASYMMKTEMKNLLVLDVNEERLHLDVME